MTAAMTNAELARALKKRGIDPDRVPMPREPVLGQLRFPATFVLDWACLISENRRFCARDVNTANGRRAKLVLTESYRVARERTRRAVSQHFGAVAAVSEPLSLLARVYLPDTKVRDVPNFAGATANALKGLLYTDDVWLYRVTWERAGIDAKHPRAEITLDLYRP